MQRVLEITLVVMPHTDRTSLHMLPQVKDTLTQTRTQDSGGCIVPESTMSAPSLVVLFLCF